jgi:hypothetical protein
MTHRAPSSTRFRKGQSGNPKGRPKAGPPVSQSAFDVILDRTLTVTQDGKPREVTLEEALQHRTYADAIAGNRSARRELLNMIVKREEWFAQNLRNCGSVQVLTEPKDPNNAEEALLLLGIAEVDSSWANLPEAGRRFRLAPWAVQHALSRGRRRLAAADVSEN